MVEKSFLKDKTWIVSLFSEEQEIKAKMKDGILTVNLPKGNEKKTTQNIVIE